MRMEDIKLIEKNDNVESKLFGVPDKNSDAFNAKFSLRGNGGEK